VLEHVEQETHGWSSWQDGLIAGGGQGQEGQKDKAHGIPKKGVKVAKGGKQIEPLE
jgi:hypothetical protein